jgi:hypothetical protein
MWMIDYSLQSAVHGIKRLYFHDGIGYKYDLVSFISRFMGYTPSFHITSSIDPARAP